METFRYFVTFYGRNNQSLAHIKKHKQIRISPGLQKLSLHTAVCRHSEPRPRVTRADRKRGKLIGPEHPHPLSAAPRRTLRGGRSAKYTPAPPQTSAPLSCPLSSRCPARALVHCSWRHTQHGGQGDSVNISYQIIILQAVTRLVEGGGQHVGADAWV